ncbi:zf-HC2 domain-containing protein [Pseudonocardia sp. C8]|uniref:zf-HC2 domain-containing protein n=1 Tax=Pseudonocardia sp. C8 TaxID=2762759 RepID=UPI0016430DE6|nr:zf-HC2 domain-containing protein [Pseudonocardia sp. C8]MBC3191141.1 zf-HC2 domain-containing protein [Pseudonocardia sp. C8]
MTCQQCREVVSASLDGEAGAADRAAAAAHLEGCPACRAYAEGAERVGRLARVGPAEQVPDIAGALLASLGISAPEPVDAPPAPPALSCLPGGCCGSASADTATTRSACGCPSTCGCGCQDGAPCRCGTRAA